MSDDEIPEIEDDSFTEAEIALFDKIVLMAYQEEKRSRTELQKKSLDYAESISTKDCVNVAVRAARLIINARREEIGRK